MNTLLLIEYKKRPQFKDPYVLNGKEKKQTLNELVDFVSTNYPNLGNPSQEDKRRFFDACNKLEAEALRQVKRVQASALFYGNLKNELVKNELEEFKTKVKLQFMEKYGPQIATNTFTAEMSKELDKISKMEQAACYDISGIDIKMKNCDTCQWKACQKKPKFIEKENNYESEENDDV